MSDERGKEKLNYVKPELKVWGKIEEITQTGSRSVSRDIKGGSVQHPPGEGL